MKHKILLILALMSVSVHVSAQFTLPALPYSYNALEPHIDEATMKIHHDVHHQAYVNNLNKALSELSQYSDTPLEELISNIRKLPENIQIAVRNNGGGHYNHSLFWTLMAPAGQSTFGGAIQSAIEQQFGSLDSFKTAFEQAAVARFGSGWVWLILDEGGQLKIISTANQDNPLMDISEVRGIPVLALDVWEHAYYLKYQAKRGDYTKAFWNVINWDEVNRRYLMKNKK